MWRLLRIIIFSILNLNIKGLVIGIRYILILCSKYCCLPYSYWMGYHRHFLYLDNIGIFLIILSVWINYMMILAMKNTDKKVYLFFNFKLLNCILVGAFLVKDFLSFFALFELSLIPTLIIILGWGIQPERIRAGSYLMIYTIIGAIPLLLCIVYKFLRSGGTSMYYFSPLKWTFTVWWDYSWFVMFWMLAFIIKLPIYGVHLWLPKAHVEAPVGGSMILAGVLLKLGAYGLIRIMYFCNITTCWWRDLRYSWLLFTMCIVGIICFRQSDLKSLVAYSSVAHMSLVMLGFYACDYIGQVGVLGMLIAHGICSSGLFFGVQCFYQLRGSRRILLNRGFIHISPILCFFWLLLCVSKASAPPSLNLLSEFLLISSILKYKKIGRIFCFLSIFLAGLFRIYLYVLSCHGKWNNSNKFWSCLQFRHYLILCLHSFPLYLLILLSNIILPC